MMMEQSNGQQKHQQVIGALQFNASKKQQQHHHQPNSNKLDEMMLVSRSDSKNQIVPKRVSTLRVPDDCDTDAKEQNHQRIHHPQPLSPAESLQKLSRLSRNHDAGLASTSSSKPGSPNFRRENSTRSLKSAFIPADFGKTSSESGSQRPFSDAASVRSWASVGMGSTDGKKMIVRRVPTSPVELFNIVNPPTPPEEYLYDGESDDGTGDDEDSIYVKPRRQHWSNKLQFVLACVGYSVGLGSVWRFPYLCYKSGGGVFLIPYAIMMIVCGVPMLYMELAVGQFTGRGPIGALGHLCPLLKGTGLGSVVISFLMSTYYSVIIAYGIYYFFTSFKAKQPWEDCSHPWNNEACWVPGKWVGNNSKSIKSQTPAEQFYDKKVLQIGDGIENFDGLRWELVACLICAWVLVYFAIWKSIKSSAKVRYFTATLPFVLIIVFLAKSLTLEGADKGMRYFFRPKFELLLEAKVWVNAAAQTFNSMGIAFGSMISFASYSKYNNNILHDTLAVSFVNAITSLLVGIFAFATIGNIATEQNTSIEAVIDDGPGLIFVVYPQAMAKMPAAQLWAVLFFFMLICLALNSQFAIVEVVVTSIQDGFPAWIKKNLMCHEVLVLIICVVSLICGLPNVTQGGIYFFQLIDHYAASISIMYLAFFEVIAISWFYGFNKLSKNVELMTGRQPSLYFKFCWMIATPLLIFSVWVFCMIDYESPTYNNGEYHYPIWAIVIGWIISALSILCIPICMVYVFIKAPGDTFLQKLQNSIKSDLFEKCPKCDEFECDCIMKEDEIEPMLMIAKTENLTSIPYYTPINRVPTVHKFDLEKVHHDKLTYNNFQKSAFNAENRNVSRHRLDNSKEDMLKVNVQNGTIPEEDRFQSDDLPIEISTDKAPSELETQTSKSDDNVKESIDKTNSVEYLSHLDVKLASKSEIGEPNHIKHKTNNETIENGTNNKDEEQNIAKE